VALADTIKVLNDDDALELFRGTLPGSSASLLQVQRTSAGVREEARALLAAARGRTTPGAAVGLDFISLALRGKEVGFEKVIKLIDELVENLKVEQQDDDNKQEYCTAQFDSSEDKKKGLEHSKADLETAIAETKDAIQTATADIAALEKGIVALDKSVAEATEQRKAENEEHKALVSSNGMAKELLLFAKNRLNKFYNPSMYKAPAKKEASEGTTQAPGGIAGTGIGAALLQLASDNAVAPPPPPATAAAYMKKGQESNGVIAMIDLLVQDLEKETTVAEAEEKAAQKEYERTMEDSAKKRAADAKSLTDREAAKAEMQTNLESSTTEVKSTTEELMATAQYIASLHAECDWLLQYHSVRKQARADEADSLAKAKAVLSGADFSLLQQRSVARRNKFLHRQ
jgi:predicted  nucleic acid-binding Zn-ribbon protein